MKKLIKPIAIMISCFFILSCGYKLSGGGRLNGNISGLNVLMFKNLTGETGIEYIITNDIIHEFLRNGIEVLNRIGASSDKSVSSLEGTINFISLSTIARTNINVSNERRVKIIINIKLIDNKGKTLRLIKNISENEEYNASENEYALENAKHDAIKRLSKRLAEKIYFQLTENF